MIRISVSRTPLLCTCTAVIQAIKVSPEDGQEYITTIDSLNFEQTTDSDNSDNINRPQMTIQIPSELLQVLKETGLIVGEEVRAVSFLYFNVENIFPSGLSDEDIRLVA